MFFSVQYPFLWLPRWHSGKESVCQCRRHKRHGLNSLVRKIPAVRNGNPLQYSCLKNSMGRGAWWAMAHGDAKSWTWPSMSTNDLFLSVAVPWWASGNSPIRYNLTETSSQAASITLWTRGRHKTEAIKQALYRIWVLIKVTGWSSTYFLKGCLFK